jgi:putative DNA primase/helicase
MDTVNQFTAAIRRAGLVPPDRIIADGELHRFASNGKASDSAGWYCLHDDELPAGVFGDWRTGLTETWRADVGRKLTDSERAKQRQHIETARAKRERAEAEMRDAARLRAATEWEAARPASDSHPYLTRKRVRAAGLRQDAGGRLLVPMFDRHGVMHSLQYIDADGGKRFLIGGRVAGCYFPIGKPSDVLCIAEGFATASTIHAASGHAVAVAFNCGNLEAVARELRAKLPDVRLVICADDDAETSGNPGLTKARAAAALVGGLVAVPVFPSPRPANASDFNDMAQCRGTQEVSRAIAAAVIEPASAWAAPMPLVSDSPMDAYPIDALPGSIGAAVREVAAFVQCPIALAACSALSSLSVAAQGVANVRRGSDLEGPTSLYLLAVAASGERKSECDRRFSSVLREWEAEQGEMLKPDLARNRADRATWDATREGVLNAIKQAKRVGESVEDARSALEKLEREKPEAIRVPRVLLESETAESLAWNLARPDGWPSGGILSSEAGIIFGGHAMRRDSIVQSLSLLNKLWSGESLRVGRRTSEQFDVNGARLTMGLAVQPETVQTFFEESRGLARGTGFAARFLIAYPESTQGTRLYRDAPQGWPGLVAFQSRLRQLLDARLQFNERGELVPQSLGMDAAAFEAWRQFHDAAEVELRASGELADVRDVASKGAENCARLAALFHLFEHGPSGQIGVASVAAAARIVTWHLFEARRFLGGMAMPKAISNAAKLEAWLLTVCRERGTASVSLRDAMRLGPNPVRPKADLLAAISELTAVERVRLSVDGRLIQINPALVERNP